jgi:hypothetical protein
MPFIAKPALAEGLNRNAVSSETQFSKPKYNLVVSIEKCGSTTDSMGCLIGFPVSVRVMSESKTIAYEKVNVIDPEGKSQVIYTTSSSINFIPTKLGQYVFEFEDQKIVVFVNPKEEKGNMRLNTHDCRSGETIFVDVVDAKGNQVSGETVEIIHSNGEAAKVFISNELNGFVPKAVGTYLFFYGKQKQTVCVKPSFDIESKLSGTLSSEELEAMPRASTYWKTINDPALPLVVSLYEIPISNLTKIRLVPGFLGTTIEELNIIINMAKDDFEYRLNVPLDEFYSIIKAINDCKKCNHAGVDRIFFDSNSLSVILRANMGASNEVFMRVDVDLIKKTSSSKYFLSSEQSCSPTATSVQ